MKAIKNRNLANEVKTGIYVLLSFKSGVDSETGIFIPEGYCTVDLAPHVKKGGFQGNTLMTNDPKILQRPSKRDIRVNNFLFSKCQLFVKMYDGNFCLKIPYGYLNLNGKIVKWINNEK